MHTLSTSVQPLFAEVAHTLTNFPKYCSCVSYTQFHHHIQEIKKIPEASVSPPGHLCALPQCPVTQQLTFSLCSQTDDWPGSDEAGPGPPAAFQTMPGDPHPAGPSLALSPWLGVYLQCGEVCDLVSQGSDAVITSINLQPRLQLHQLLVPTSVVPRSQTGGLG